MERHSALPLAMGPLFPTETVNYAQVGERHSSVSLTDRGRLVVYPDCVSFGLHSIAAARCATKTRFEACLSQVLQDKLPPRSGRSDATLIGVLRGEACVTTSLSIMVSPNQPPGRQLHTDYHQRRKVKRNHRHAKHIPQ